MHGAAGEADCDQSSKQASRLLKSRSVRIADVCFGWDIGYDDGAGF